MVATLGMAVGEVDKCRICKYVGRRRGTGTEDKDDRRMQRHVVTICQIELFASSVEAAKCRMSLKGLTNLYRRAMDPKPSPNFVQFFSCSLTGMEESG